MTCLEKETLGKGCPSRFSDKQETLLYTVYNGGCNLILRHESKSRLVKGRDSRESRGPMEERWSGLSGKDTSLRSKMPIFVS